MKQNRPRIELQKTTADQRLDLIIIGITIAMICMPLYFYTQLPDIISIHFNAAGEVDGHGSKQLIWIIPVIGILMYLGMNQLLKFPHTFNYPTKVTEENAERLYKSAVKMMRYILLFTQLVILFIIIATIYSALQSGKSLLGPWFLITVLLTSIGIPLILSYRMSTDMK